MVSPDVSDGSIPGPVIARLRGARPVVHAITNAVVANWVANVLLAAGSSPVMAQAAEEVAGFTAVADALAVNLGTLGPAASEGIRLAVRTACERGLPWALDPVGVGASTYRLALARQLLAMRPAVIRGNADEILTLAGAVQRTERGVDSAAGSLEALDAAHRLAAETGAVVALTGETDFVVCPHGESAPITGGDPMARLVTGMGCATTALIAAALAVSPPRDAAVTGLWLMKAAAAAAARRATGPGGFAAAVLDAIHAETRRMAVAALSIAVYGILDPQIARGRSLADLARQAANAGVDLLQYRAKETGVRAMIEEAAAIVAALQGSGVPLLVNDRVDVALASGAQGVHLGRDDMRPAAARRLLGPHAVIGATIKNSDDIAALVGEPIDYGCIGGVYATSHKDNPDAPVGVDGFTRLRSEARSRLGPIPVGAIAGITPANARPLFAAGADGVAVMGGLFLADDLAAAVRAFRRAATTGAQAG
jgi:thiamine-phosphate pyrophosphorylase